MGFHIKNNKVIADASFEEEVMRLCLQYPNLKVFVGHSRRAANAALYFFEALPIEMRKKYNKIPINKWEICLPNGSSVRFINFTIGAGMMLPEPPIHIFIAYGVKNQVIIRNMCQSMVAYDSTMLTKGHKNLFPLFNDKPGFNVDGFVFAGSNFWDEYSRIADKVAMIKETSNTVVYYKPDVGYKPDISAYDTAQALYEEEQDEIALLRQELEEQKGIRQALEKKLANK